MGQPVRVSSPNELPKNDGKHISHIGEKTEFAVRKESNGVIHHKDE